MLISIYLAAIITANLTIIWFGPSVSIINAFLLIGLDLSLRDQLHDQWEDGLIWRMGALIGSGSLITVCLNVDALPIAVASAAAFASAAVGDSIVYHLLRRKVFLVRANGSNVVGAALDSVIFPILAFGWPPLIPIILGQFCAKVLGGAIWSFILRRYIRR
jgi:hypothetical protein